MISYFRALLKRHESFSPKRSGIAWVCGLVVVCISVGVLTRSDLWKQRLLTEAQVTRRTPERPSAVPILSPHNNPIGDQGNAGVTNGEPFGYVDRPVSKQKYDLGEIHLDLLPDPPGFQRRPVNVCFKEQFNAVRSPITLEELYGLLGRPLIPLTFSGGQISWACEDGRSLTVYANFSADLKQSFGFNESIVEDLSRGHFEMGEMRMTKLKGSRVIRYYVIPARKPGEVEFAIKKQNLIRSTHPS